MDKALKIRNRALLKEGWTVLCESPFELEHEDGSSIKGQFAKDFTQNLTKNYNLNEENCKLLKCFDLTKLNDVEIIKYMNTLDNNTYRLLKTHIDEYEDSYEVSIEFIVNDDQYVMLSICNRSLYFHLSDADDTFPSIEEDVLEHILHGNYEPGELFKKQSDLSTFKNYVKDLTINTFIKEEIINLIKEL